MAETKEHIDFQSIFGKAFETMEKIGRDTKPEIAFNEVGRLTFIGDGVASIEGLPDVGYQELVEFKNNKIGLAFNLDRNSVSVVMLDEFTDLDTGDEARRTGRVMDVPVGEALLGRQVDAIGRPIDNKGDIESDARWPIERKAPPIMHRLPVKTPLQSGILVIDSLIPVGRGQRELILGDRQTGKTAIATDTIINQRDKDVICIYCAIGQRSTAIAQVIADLEKSKAIDNTIVIEAKGNEPPGMKYVAPYAATTMGEYFMENGKDALVIYDDLTKHARAYRELSLLLRRPPAREAYPGDIFYVHSRLLERSTHLKEEYGGGSLTALPIIETQEQNLSAYIPTNLISITDGQIYLNPDLFQEGVLPAIDVGQSVSRVGGKTQLEPYTNVSGDLRLSYSQFEELESFARFGTKLDEETRKTLERGRRIREVFKQDQFDPIPVPEQIAILIGLTEGKFDKVDIDHAGDVKEIIRKKMDENEDISKSILKGNELSDDQKNEILELIDNAVKQVKGSAGEGKKQSEDKESSRGKEQKNEEQQENEETDLDETKKSESNEKSKKEDAENEHKSKEKADKEKDNNSNDNSDDKKDKSKE